MNGNDLVVREAFRCEVTDLGVEIEKKTLKIRMNKPCGTDLQKPRRRATKMAEGRECLVDLKLSCE